jgi:hypothetical protein
MSPANRDPYPLVPSPMLLQSQSLGIKRAQFTHSREQGTMTMLECVMARHLGGDSSYWSHYFVIRIPACRSEGLETQSWRSFVVRV